MRRAALILTFVGGIQALSAQAPPPAAPSAPAPAFDVASVRENTSDTQGGGISGPTPGRFTVTNIPLRFIILDAFQLRDHQLIGAPDWTFTARYDVVATYPPGTMPTAALVRQMVQRLLADRFRLVTHVETREMPLFALVLARRDGRPGAQLVRSNTNCEQWLAEGRPQMGAGGRSPVAPGGARPACMMWTSRQMLTGGTRTIQQLTASLQSLTGRPVVDRTGLTGTFDIDLQWAGDAPAAPLNGPPLSADAPSFFTALEEQLGLKLEPGRGPFDVLVVDAIERATEN